MELRKLETSMMAAGETVLLVDDMPTNLEMLIQELIKNNYRVLIAETGKFALECVRYTQVDIILLDVVLPDMDGFEICRQFKANSALQDVPILFISALDEVVDKVRGFAVGGVDFITKPLQLVEVLARIRTHLTIRLLQQELQSQNQLLEKRVEERTAQLQAEITQRQRQEEQKQKLLDVLERQSEQLRELTTWLIKNNQQHSLRETVIHPLLQRVQQIYHHLEILSTIVATLQNTTSRYQITVQVEDLQRIANEIKDDLEFVQRAHHETASHLCKSLDDPLLKLSTREREVLQLIIDGNSNAQIAEILYLSETTVRSHRSRLLQKLGLEDTIALVKFAVQHNLTTV